MKPFLVTVEFIRRAELTIEAIDALDARNKAANFDFEPDLPTELIGWRVADVAIKSASGPGVISEATALSLAIEKIHENKTIQR